MEDVRDGFGKLVCRADYVTGKVEIKTRDGRYAFALPVGETLVFEKGIYITCVTRASPRHFECGTYIKD